MMHGVTPNEVFVTYATVDVSVLLPDEAESIIQEIKVKT
jgi:hypothetical protein